MRRVLADRFTIVYGTRSSIAAAHYRDAAIKFANRWFAVGHGVATIIADAEFNTNQTHTTPNLILLGGIESNSVTQWLQPEQPVQMLQAEVVTAHLTGASARIETGFGIGGCEFRELGTGIVSLSAVATEGGRGLAVIVAGTTLGGFGDAITQLQSNLFETNSWQHRVSWT